MQPYSHSRHGDFSAFVAKPLQQWRYLSHAHTYAHTHANALCSHAVIASMQPYSHSRHGDFSAFTANAATAAMEMSQPRSCSIRIQSCSHSRHGDFSAPAAYAVTAAIEMSQPYGHAVI